ncbi:hypothetical protein PT282_05935 [Bifidobacterium sp. ESL0763]|uniref:hypothetical protein n=1 Tax=Bifidobacterium sp. ESL0763 TaxID=2983227 RepID=UPI0023F8E02C|nr:hypothetical protein [Bifidobacterium sp. ESL0763]MDF7664199.1 hypothetical protein [Bifidobacterium sp. ESL0763]
MVAIATSSPRKHIVVDKPVMLSDGDILQKIKDTAVPFGGEERLRSKEKRNMISLDEMLALQRIDSFYYLLNGE